MAPVGAAKTLRVAILGIKVPEARRYHISVQVLAKGQAPAGVVALDGATFDLRPDQVSRTETTPLEASPMFLNRVFVLRLPDSLAKSHSILLHCNLFAAPSLGTDNAGALVAGKEVDELVGAATLQIRGDVAARLLRGERCTLPAVLGSGTSEDAGGVKDTLALTSMFGTRATREVLLELMLLDAHLTLPRDAPLLPAPAPTEEESRLALLSSFPGTNGGLLAATMGAAGQSKSGALAAGGSLQLTPCKLKVLVVRAENLPTMRNAEGQEVVPDTFVSAATLKEVRSRSTPKSVTDTVHGSQNPAWGQLLEVPYTETELDEEQLCLGIVNDSDSRLMLKASVPLAGLIPRVHYNLRITMPGGPLGSSVAIYVSMCLVSSPGRELRQLQLAKPPLSHLLEARVAECSQQMGALIKAARHPSGTPFQEVFGLWHVHPSSSPQADGATSNAGTEPPLQPIKHTDVYTHVDANNLGEAQKKMQALTAKLAAPLQQSQSTTDVLPLLLAGKDGVLWDVDHMVSLLLQDPGNFSLQLELHALSPGKPESLPLGRACLPLPSVGLSLPSSDCHSSSSVHKNIPLLHSSAQGATCNMELCLWQLPAYLQRLQKALPPPDAATMSSLQDAKTILSQMSWLDQDPSQKMMASSMDQQQLMGLTSGGGRASVAVLEALVDDLLMKQIAIERIIRQNDGTEARNEMMKWRVADAEQRSKTMAQENARLRQLLHEDKEAQRSPPMIEVNPNLSKEQLVERAETALSAYSRERRRNLELVHRLQQMHNEQVDVLEMKKRYQELQTAHMELGKVVSDPSNNANKISKYRATVKTQEEVISNLELLLAQATAKAKALPSLEAKHKAAAAELDRLRRGPLIELDSLKKGPMRELEQLRKSAQPPPAGSMNAEQLHGLRQDHARELHDLRAKQTELEEQLQDAQQERYLLEEEKERQKAKAEVSRDELVHTIKRYAEEISVLKWKLAEKDAQLMGGFGSGTPPWMSNARPTPLATPPDQQGSERLSPLSTPGHGLGQLPAYSPSASSQHSSARSTPARTPPKPLSPPIPPPNHQHQQQLQHQLHQHQHQQQQQQQQQPPSGQPSRVHSRTASHSNLGNASQQGGLPSTSASQPAPHTHATHSMHANSAGRAQQPSTSAAPPLHEQQAAPPSQRSQQPPTFYQQSQQQFQQQQQPPSFSQQPSFNQQPPPFPNQLPHQRPPMGMTIPPGMQPLQQQQQQQQQRPPMPMSLPQQPMQIQQQQPHYLRPPMPQQLHTFAPNQPPPMVRAPPPGLQPHLHGQQPNMQHQAPHSAGMQPPLGPQQQQPYPQYSQQNLQQQQYQQQQPNSQPAQRASSAEMSASLPPGSPLVPARSSASARIAPPPADPNAPAMKLPSLQKQGGPTANGQQQQQQPQPKPSFMGRMLQAAWPKKD